MNIDNNIIQIVKKKIIRIAIIFKNYHNGSFLNYNFFIIINLNYFKYSLFL